LRVSGGGTRAVGRRVEGQILPVAGLSGITLYEPGALTLVVRAGTPLAEVQATLAHEGQHLPFEVPDWRALLGTSGEPTIGGAVAANASGPRRVQAGACRDSLIGVRFVDGSGMVVRNGGRVMKNVTGYDLVKLMAGSWGTLGVLTEVAFKVLPRPETVASIEIEGLADARAVEAMSAALGSPFDVSGASHVAGGVTRVRVEGFATSVAYRARRLEDLLGRFGPVRVVQGDAAAGDWAAIRDLVPLAGLSGDVWRLAGRPSDMAAIVARAGCTGAVYDWGGGVAHVLVDEGTDLRARLGPFGGHATLIRAAPRTRARIASFPPRPPALAALDRGLRSRFDPRGILNPGLMD
jgi:glycolate oxidase FAD binding subunit